MVSGFDEGGTHIDANPMCFFHEPLGDSLRRLGRFAGVRLVGRHSSIVVYRCDVSA